MKEYLLKLGLNITYYRKSMGMTQAELAELSHISRNHLGKIENGTCASLDTLMNIAEVLNISLSELFEFRD